MVQPHRTPPGESQPHELQLSKLSQRTPAGQNRPSGSRQPGASGGATVESSPVASARVATSTARVESSVGGATLRAHAVSRVAMSALCLARGTESARVTRRLSIPPRPSYSTSYTRPTRHTAITRRPLRRCPTTARTRSTRHAEHRGGRDSPRRAASDGATVRASDAGRRSRPPRGRTRCGTRVLSRERAILAGGRGAGGVREAGVAGDVKVCALRYAPAPTAPSRRKSRQCIAAMPTRRARSWPCSPCTSNGRCSGFRRANSRSPLRSFA